jgi:hypothetical protein
MCGFVETLPCRKRRENDKNLPSSGVQLHASMALVLRAHGGNIVRMSLQTN